MSRWGTTVHKCLKRLFSLKRHSFDGELQKAHEFSGEDHPQKPTWKCFSFEEIFAATNGFSSDNMVGKGGYAEVYKGVLEDEQTVAVKRLTKTASDERKEKEFLTEIGILGHVSHPNVTPLLGCCIDNGLYLVFEFSSKGSVASLLHDENSPAMDWKTRFKIATGTARGLHYLHKSCPRRIIHRDIKASNVLLAADFEPQISDFGLAKWLPSQWSHHSIAPIEGTFGHLAPEYFMHGVVDEKTDVFAFGVFLLELVSGKKPVDGSHKSLHSWAKPILNRGGIKEVIDPRLEENYDEIQLTRLAYAASLCIRSSPIWRPTMTEVLDVILMEEDLEREKWNLEEGEREGDGEEEFWGFEDLECDGDDDDDDSSWLSSSSLQDSVSVSVCVCTGNSGRDRDRDAFGVS
ncbi:probable receptor-like serine/threonine-protein kinase At5g57670 isoform X1 [Andrographis paniculata]|uniref:probable receptor-like serine/threonine-protein kinase At5g57670 isoform X1 n=2 Tax=Andrographis paniculata TaxID=175694 RepID=UPI0021E84E1B|nr:probable receptor-like serine/threonine-protein kinase At5g57670 isoform X1 [Andrographis paniculata]